MTSPPQQPFAAGREADVFALGDGRVLRRLDDAVILRRRQPTLSAEEIGALPAAAARVGGAG